MEMPDRRGRQRGRVIVPGRQMRDAHDELAEDDGAESRARPDEEREQHETGLLAGQPAARARCPGHSEAAVCRTANRSAARLSTAESTR